MSITTSQRVNGDQLLAALPAGAFFGSFGADLTTAGSKVITAINTDDATLQAAVTAAAAAFVDRPANQAAITANVTAAQTQIQAFIAANPGGATLTGPQTIVLAKMLNGLCKLLLAQYASTTGT